MDTPNLATWSLRGPVQMMSSYISEWDPARQEWGPPRHHTKLSFDNRGRLIEMDQPGGSGLVHRSTYRYDAGGRLIEIRAGHVGSESSLTRHQYDDRGRLVRVVRTSDDGIEETIETCSYDERGRRTRVQRFARPADGYGVDGTEYAYGAPNARTQTTRYDEHERPAVSEFHDADGNVVRRIRFERDAEGRTILEEASIEQPLPATMAAQLTPEDREKLLALVRQTFETIATRYTYDEDGRLAERFTTMGRLSEERHLFRYDEYGNRTSEICEQHSREMGVGDDGTAVARNERAHRTETEFKYVYDAPGNWIERVVLWRAAADMPFKPTNVERRSIEYY